MAGDKVDASMYEADLSLTRTRDGNWTVRARENGKEVVHRLGVVPIDEAYRVACVYMSFGLPAVSAAKDLVTATKEFHDAVDEYTDHAIATLRARLASNGEK